MPLQGPIDPRTFLALRTFVHIALKITLDVWREACESNLLLKLQVPETLPPPVEKLCESSAIIQGLHSRPW